MKRIGITMRYEKEDKIEFVRQEYLDYVRPYFIPILLPMENYEELLEECDCFLITGGDDINPDFYYDSIDKDSVYVDRRIDLLDKAVIDYAIKKERPLFGICRGLQSLNVFLGGSLIQDIDGEIHKNKTDGQPCLMTGNGKHLKNILPHSFNINSYHHQGIKELAPDLLNVGTSLGMVEIVEHKTKPIYAVQWHPEKLNTLESKNLITYLVDLTEQYC